MKLLLSSCTRTLRMQLQLVDWLIIFLYFAFVVGVGFLIRSKIKSSDDYLSSDRQIPCGSPASPSCPPTSAHGKSSAWWPPA
ncbi:MAG: hypothetical protein U0V64_15160 [Cyclobacteriaceae bacterium]